MSDTSLPPVNFLTCQRQLSFTEFQRIVTELMTRDRVLEEAVLNFTSADYLQNTIQILAATQLILNQDLVSGVISSGQLPVGFQDFQTFQNNVNQSIASLEDATTIASQNSTSSPQSLKSIVQGTQTTLAAISTQVTNFATQLAAIQAATANIATVTTSIANLSARVTDLESLTASMSQELRNARIEFASDPSKQLADKINEMDSISEALQQNLTALTKEVTDARNPSQYDTLAEHIGDIEATIQSFQDTLNSLSGAGSVNSLRVGRSVLHGDVELIPGSNIAITRERNGYRIDVVDVGTVIDLAAPRIDPNNCCGPGLPSFGN